VLGKIGKRGSQFMKVTTGLFTVGAASVLTMFSACTSQTNSPPTAITGAMTVESAGTFAAAGSAAPAVAGSFATAGSVAPAVAGSFATAGTVAPVVAGSFAAAGASAAGTSAASPIAGASGGAAGTAAASGAATFTAVLAIFADPMINCGQCHGVMSIGGGLLFKPTDKAGTYAALVGPVSQGMSGSQCAGHTYVVPGMPDASLLYDKLSKVTPTCGVRMPASGVVLSDAQIATVRAWIMAGALNN
jgi:hypothetical protein